MLQLNRYNAQAGVSSLAIGLNFFFVWFASVAICPLSFISLPLHRLSPHYPHSLFSYSKKSLTRMTSIPTSTKQAGTTYWNIQDLMSRIKYRRRLFNKATRCLQKKWSTAASSTCENDSGQSAVKMRFRFTMRNFKQMIKTGTKSD